MAASVAQYRRAVPWSDDHGSGERVRYLMLEVRNIDGWFHVARKPCVKST
jgi:hypothetical protein